MLSFSERYRAIEGATDGGQDVVINGKVKAESRKKLIAVFGAACVALLIIVAIIIAFVSGGSPQIYYDSGNITTYNTYDSQTFYSIINGAGIYPQVDASAHSVYTYAVYYYGGGETENIQGGGFYILDEDENGGGLLMAN